jgi:hypothetical protein
MRLGLGFRSVGRALFVAGVVLGSAFDGSQSLADVTAVPATIQAELLAKLEGYDRGFAARAGDTARILLLVKPGSTKSALSAEEMASALSKVVRIGGLPHKDTIVTYEGPDALARKCRAERVAVVYVTPGFEDAEVPALRTALDGTSVLTLAAVSRQVPLGITLGFELESGKPKLVLNLSQARRQKVDFPGSLLQLMKVYQ